MDLTALPTKILHNIFTNYLSGKDIYSLRGANRRWKGIIDELCDSVWQKLCQRDYSDVYEDAQSKAKLSWQNLYKSLMLWPKLPSATIKCHLLPIIAYNLSVLENGVIAVPQYSKKVKINIPGYCTDSIVYYDSKTLEECRRETFNFVFGWYQENDKLIPVVDAKDRLILVSKSNKKRHCVGSVPRVVSSYNIFKGFRIFEDTVYFKNTSKEICVCTLEHRDVKTVVIPFDEDVVAYTLVKTNHVNILTKRGDIFTLMGYKLNHVLSLNKFEKKEFDVLKTYNFNWTYPSIPNWLHGFGFGKSVLHSEILNFEFRYPSRIYIYGKVVIVGFKTRIDVYWNLSKNGKPMATINLDAGLDEFYENSKLKVVEIENGHRIIVYLLRKIFVINCVH